MKLIACTAAALALLTAASAQSIQVDRNNRTIAVTTTDSATEPADIATVSIGFQLYAPDADTAYRLGSQTSNAIVDALQKSGVPEKAIESQQQNLTRSELYGNDITPEERAQRQFTLTQSWTVHTSASDAARVLNIAVQAGANNSGNIDWNVADRKTLQAQAAEKALVCARAIATQMATGLDAHLGTLLYASNQTPAPPVVPLAMMEAKAAPRPAPVRPLAIRPQQIEESATVYAVFAIE